MPVAGGSADKLGNVYEMLWTISRVLEVVRGSASEILLEPLRQEESRGIEFRLTLADGTSEFWSVKRQTTRGAGWTLACLTTADEKGRTILGDLAAHVEARPSNHAVFASTMAAPQPCELQACARDRALFLDRLEKSAHLKVEFQKRIVPLFSNDADRARRAIRRIRAHATDERLLQERVDLVIRMTFYRPDGSAIDPAAVRGYLEQLLVARLHEPISRETVLAALDAHGVRVRDWAADVSVQDVVTMRCDSFCGSLHSQLIGGALISLETEGDLFPAGDDHTRRRILLAGEVANGSECVERWPAAGLDAVSIWPKVDITSHYAPFTRRPKQLEL